MELRVISNYGEHERTVTKAATPGDVVRTMQSLEWQGFHQVVLTDANGDWLEVGGSLNPQDGLSAMYQEHGRQFVTVEPPRGVEQMTELLLGFLAGSGDWKQSVKWE